LGEVKRIYATNGRRRLLFDGLLKAASRLHAAGCGTLFLDGGYVSGKPQPRDFDACWDPNGVERSKLDPVFLDFNNGRAAQKAAFMGEFFPSTMTCIDVGQSFMEFFQTDRFTGLEKGILSISLSGDPLILGMVQP
jgi:hypothetical protein